MDLYNKYICTIELIHYDFQFNRKNNFKGINAKRMIKNYFSFFISMINSKDVIEKRKFNRILLKFKIKSLLYFIKI